MQTPNSPLPTSVVAALKNGNAIEAIKLLREAKGIGLIQAFAEVASNASRIQEQGSNATTLAPLSAAALAALARGDKIEAIRAVRQETGLGLKEAKAAVEATSVGLPRQIEGLAPGEVPQSNTGLWVLAALAIGAAVYLLVR